MADEMKSYYGVDEPSASYKWGVVVPVIGNAVGHPQTVWRAIAWFKSRKRAVEYANTGWSTYAIARMK